MEHEPVFWLVVAVAVAAAVALGLAVALLTTHGGEDEPGVV
jgi:hypothetical protein